MIAKINENKYKITIDCGKTGEKRKRISKIFYGSYEEAKYFEKELKKQNNFYTEKNDSFHKENEIINLNKVIDMYLQLYCENNLKTNTIYNYKSLLKTIRKELGDIPIKDINVLTLENYYYLLKNENYSSNTIIHHYNLINALLEQALKWELINKNPNSLIKKPKLTKNEADFYTQEELKLLLNALENEPLNHQVPIILTIDTGMRREELNGLLWKDIDFETNTVHINKVRIAVGDKILVEDTKTKYSQRIITVSDFTINKLKKLKESQKRQFEKLNKKWKEDNYVFLNDKCNPYYPDSLSKIFKKILKRYNLRIITFHQLRHTNATLLINSNTDIKTVSKRLGHANISTTLNIYTHVLDKTEKQVAQKMNEIFQNN